MSTNVANVLTAIEALTPAERDELMEHLFDDADDEDPPPLVLSEEWKAELARRSAEIAAGGVSSTSWAEIKARWAAERAGGG